MKIVVTGGGTAGHVTPLLAVASEIIAQQPNAQVRYIGKYGDPMGAAVKKHSAIEKDYKIFAGKLRRFYGKSWYWYLTQPKLVLHNIKDGILFALGFMQSLCWLILWRPQVVFVKGGYVGLPVGLAAVVLRIPIVTHDSDVMPGLTNRVLSRYAKALAVGAPVKQYPQYANKNVHYTGVPVREDFLQPLSTADAKRQLNLEDYNEVIVIIGGSLGAVRVNKVVIANIDSLLKNHKKRAIYWLTGSFDYDAAVRAVNENTYAGRLIVRPYSDELPLIFAAATVVITRAGATTLAELSIMKKPTIIIPNPLLTGGHQTKNAIMLQEKHAALVITESELARTPELLTETVNKLISDKDLQETLTRNFTNFSIPTAAKDIARLIISTIES